MPAIKIVIVDDDAATLRLLEKIIGKAGYEVIPCTNGDDAYDLVVREQPVILLADWEMPGLTGVQLCQKIRETLPEGAAYILLLTSNDTKEYVVAGFEAGVDDYITKPAYHAELLARIRAGERLLRLLMEQEMQARQSKLANMLHRVTMVASDARSFKSALQQAIDVICETIGWPVGHVYVPAGEDTCELKPTGIWHLDEPIPVFVETTEKTRFPPGIGLPGRILKSQRPAWISNVQSDPNFPRSWISDDIGVKGAFGFPVTISGEVVAVLEFFSRNEMSVDEGLLEVMYSVGEQIGRVFERRRSEKQLRLQSAALEAAANAIVIADTNGFISWANPAFSDLTGYSLEEVIEQNTRLFKSGEQDQVFYADLWNTILSGNVWHGELINRKKDGTLYPEEMTVTPVRDEKNEITHFIAIKQDISIRKQAETECIKRIEIEQERNLLRDSVNAHERVLGVVGHELRTPLAGVRAMAEFLIDEGSRDMAEFDTFLRNIHDEVVRMSGMVNDLLEVARMHSGAAQWNWSEVHLQESCEAAMNAVRPLVDQDRVKLMLDVQPTDLTMLGDPDAIRRLVLNLLNNACKNTSEGSIRIEVNGLERDGHHQVKIEISDTGAGMTQEIAKRLGEAFALNSGVVGENHVKGSGLGLSICKGIAAAHGGSIVVNTQIGSGTSLTVTLRADLTEPMSSENPAEIVCEVS